MKALGRVKIRTEPIRRNEGGAEAYRKDQADVDPPGLGDEVG